MKCAGCLKIIKDSVAIKCTTDNCNKSFCALCSNAPSLTSERKKLWKCPDCCAEQKKGGDSTQKPVRCVLEAHATLRKKTDPAIENISNEGEIKNLTAAISRLTNEFSALKKKLEEVTQSLCFCQERMDELHKNNINNVNRIIKLEKRDREVVTLQATVTRLQDEVNLQSQQNLLNEIEIVGIPKTPNENLEHIVKVATIKIGVRLDDGDFDWIKRVGPRHPPASTSEQTRKMSRIVVVRLVRRSKRNQLIKSAKSRTSLTSTDLDITGNTNKIYFNERLTKQNRILFHEARVKAKSHGYSFCWSSDGNIYIRQREGRAAQHIGSLLVLDRTLPSLLAGKVSQVPVFSQKPLFLGL